MNDHQKLFAKYGLRSQNHIGAVGTFALVVLAATAWGQNAPPCGQSLASYESHGHEIIAYSNGPQQWSTNDCDPLKERPPYGVYGRQFQCTEYVKRFYSMALGMKSAIHWTGDAIDYFASANTDLPHVHANNKGLIPYANPSSTPPAPDDILVFRDSTNTEGHVAIVTSVTATGITFIEQNWSVTGAAGLDLIATCTGASCSYKVNDRMSYPKDNPGGVSFPVVGWLRLPSSGSGSDTGVVAVSASLDGNMSWSSGPRAPISYYITGGPNNQTVPGTTDIPFTSLNTLLPGSYTLVFTGGGPPNSVLTGILPCSVLTRGPTCGAMLNPGQTLSFVLQFSSVNAVYAQTSYNSFPAFCMYSNGSLVGNCGSPVVWAWQEPAGNPAGKLGSITLKLQVQSTPEFIGWNGGTSGPGDFGQVLAWSQQLYTGGTIGSSSCISTNSATVTAFVPDTWQDFSFTFDPSTCPIDFSKGDQVYALYVSRGGFYGFSAPGWAIAAGSDGQLYAIMRSQ